MRFGGRPWTNSAPASTGAGQPGSRSVSMRPPDARPRLQHRHAQPRLDEAVRGLQAGDAGADDDDVRVEVGSSWHGGKHARG